MYKTNNTCNVKVKCKKTFHNKDNVVEKATQCHIVSDCTDIYISLITLVHAWHTHYIPFPYETGKIYSWLIL